MQLGRAFSYVFEDEKWLTKTLINGLLNMIPIINLATPLFATAFMVHMHKRIAREAA